MSDQEMLGRLVILAMLDYRDGPRDDETFDRMFRSVTLDIKAAAPSFDWDHYIESRN